MPYIHSIRRFLLCLYFRLAFSSPSFCRTALFLTPGRTGGLFPRINTPKKSAAAYFAATDFNYSFSFYGIFTPTIDKEPKEKFGLRNSRKAALKSDFMLNKPYFAISPLFFAQKARKNLSCHGRQKRFLLCSSCAKRYRSKGRIAKRYAQSPLPCVLPLQTGICLSIIHFLSFEGAQHFNDDTA